MDRIRYLLGLATLAVAVFGGWVLFEFLDPHPAQGQIPVRLVFADARGLKDGAFVRTHGVVVGTVQQVQLDDSGARANVRLLLDPDVGPHLRESTAFWVVTPRFGGLADGATGLDTLVRDTYVSFVTLSSEGEPLAPNSKLRGREKPPNTDGSAALEPLHPQDLEMELLVPQNYGMRPGSRLLFRGMETGEVRSVVLDSSGTFVRLGLRVFHQHRHTVTETSRFWVARPTFSVELMSGISLEDVDALLAPYVAYYTEPGSGVPVQGGYRVAAEVERPRFEVSTVPPSALLSASRGTVEERGLALTRIVYEARKRNMVTADEPIRRASTGLLYRSGSGALLAVTTRSACDGAWFVEGSFQSSGIVDEDWQLIVPDGGVYTATRAWVHPVLDLAVLEVANAPSELAGTLVDRWNLVEDPVAAHRSVGADPKGATLGAVLLNTQSPGVGLPSMADHRGSAILDEGGRVIGTLGQRSASDTTAVIVPIGALPEAYRPGS